MKRVALIFGILPIFAAGTAFADIAYLAPDNNTGNLDNNNQIGFSGYPTISGGFDVGNTITLSGAGTLDLQTVDLFGYAGGSNTSPFPTVEVSIYSGTDPNTGTLLGSATANLTGNGWLVGGTYPSEVVNFNGLVLPTDTITYIVSVSPNNGSYDDDFVNWQQFTAVSGPTVGSGDGVMWYGTAPGNFVSDTTFAEATGASSNYLAAEFDTTPGSTAVPEPASVVLLGTLLFGAGIAGRRRFGSRQ